MRCALHRQSLARARFPVTFSSKRVFRRQSRRIGLELDRTPTRRNETTPEVSLGLQTIRSVETAAITTDLPAQLALTTPLRPAGNVGR